MRSLAQGARGTLRAAFALLLAATAAACAAACGETPETPLASQELIGMRSDMVGYDNHTYIYGENGLRTAQIHADSAYYFQDSSAVHMVGVEMQVYNEDGPSAGAVRATVTADRGRYDERSQGMHAQGHVVLVMPEGGRRVESGELYYEPVNQRIWSDSASTFYHGGQVTRGTCFKSDLSFKNYTVCNIRGSAQVDGAAAGGG